MTIVETRPITGGVDTHLEVHVAAVLDGLGGVLGVDSFPTTTDGFADLYAWMSGFGTLERVGVEGTGAYGAGLARFLRGVGVEVMEVDRPNRQARRRHGKCATVDAVEAARAALSGRAHGTAKTADGNVEALRVLLVAHRSGQEARGRCLNQLRHLGFCAPDELRERFRGVPVDRLAEAAAGLRPYPNGDPVIYATKLAMQTLGRRVLDINRDTSRINLELAGGEACLRRSVSAIRQSRQGCRGPNRLSRSTKWLVRVDPQSDLVCSGSPNSGAGGRRERRSYTLSQAEIDSPGSRHRQSSTPVPPWMMSLGKPSKASKKSSPP